MERKIIKSNDGIDISYHLTKSDINDKRDKWIVFLHGLGGDLTAWSNERRYFDNLGYSTVAIDLRGHGLSGRPENKADYTFDILAEDVKRVIEHENIKSPMIVGHCFGGMVSMFLTSKYSHNISSLVLVDTSYQVPFFSQHKTSQVLVEHLLENVAHFLPSNHIAKHISFKDFANSSDVDPVRLFSDIVHASLKSYFYLLSDVIELDATKLLKSITLPTLVIEGAKDSVFPPEVAAMLRDHIINSELELITDANHIVVTNSPKKLDEVIHHYMQKLNY
jgi:pimeloyl-ACP methyl ester carboxylesterase